MIEVCIPHPDTLTVEGTVRRALDITVSVLSLLLLLPVIAVAAALVKLSSPGPVLFCHKRVGRQGRAFDMYKFRTMRAASPGPWVTARSDARITPVGAILRSCKVDEIPQLINVLRGDMSVVGPRPEVPEYVRRFTSRQREILSVRPGITGATQLRFLNEEALLDGRKDVERYYVNTVLPAKCAMDMAYLRERSLWGDTLIIVQTILSLISPLGILRPIAASMRFRNRLQRTGDGQIVQTGIPPAI